jgi:hypothetical protein
MIFDSLFYRGPTDSWRNSRGRLALAGVIDLCFRPIFFAGGQLWLSAASTVTHFTFFTLIED